LAEEKREKQKKQVPLRLSTDLWNELSAWAEDDFRSLNGQIEYLLHQAVVDHKRGGNSRQPEEPEDCREPDAPEEQEEKAENTET